jgi:hypothetical protein
MELCTRYNAPNVPFNGVEWPLAGRPTLVAAVFDASANAPPPAL